MAFVVIKSFCIFSILGLTAGTVFVEDRLYPDYDQRRVDIEDRLPFAEIPSEKREVSSSPFEDYDVIPFDLIPRYSEIVDDSYIKEPVFYGNYDESYNPYKRKTRQKVNTDKSKKIERFRSKLFSWRKHKNKINNYKGNVKDQPSANGKEEKKENLSKPRHSDVIPNLNEISV